MPQTRPNGVTVPINSDEYNPTLALETMADSIRVLRPVADKAARDALTPFVGMQVSRLDRDGWIQTYTGQTTSGWEYKGAPTRVSANVGAFTNTSGTASRLLLTLTGFTKPYAQTFSARLRLSINCGSITTGTLQVNAAVSGLVGSVASAQGRAALAWTNPGAYLQTAVCETGQLNVAAGNDPLIRAWVEVTAGTVTNTVSTDPSYSQFYVDIRPQDD